MASDIIGIAFEERFAGELAYLQLNYSAKDQRRNPVVHGVFHDVPLFLASFAAFLGRATGAAQASEDACACLTRGPPSIIPGSYLLPVPVVRFR